MTEQELIEIKDRVEKASPAPWKRACLDVYTNVHNKEDTLIAKVEWNTDAEFIAHAREDIPKLLLFIETLLKDRENCYSSCGIVLDLENENIALKKQLELMKDTFEVSEALMEEVESLKKK